MTHRTRTWTAARNAGIEEIEHSVEEKLADGRDDVDVRSEVEAGSEDGQAGVAGRGMSE